MCTCCRLSGNRDSCQSSPPLASSAQWQRGWTGGGVHVCESIRVSVYKTATGLHLSCHVGDLCLSLPHVYRSSSLSLFADRWQAVEFEVGIEILVEIVSLKGKKKDGGKAVFGIISWLSSLLFSQFNQAGDIKCSGRRRNKNLICHPQF